MTLSTTQQTNTGWIIFVAAVGMIFGLISVDIVTLHSWDQAVTPVFVGTTIGHLAAVIAAFVGGKLIPSEVRDPGDRTRASDKGAA